MATLIFDKNVAEPRETGAFLAITFQTLDKQHVLWVLIFGLHPGRRQRKQYQRRQANMVSYPNPSAELNEEAVYRPLSNEDICQVLVNFTNGTLDQHEETGLNFGYYQSTGKTQPKKRILVAESNRLQYVGTNKGDKEELAKYYVLLRNKKTNKVQVLGAERFQLEPTTLRSGQHLSEVDEVDAEENLTFSQKADLLTGAFGSSKKRRAMQSRLKSTVTGAALETAVESAVSQAFSDTTAGSLSNPVKKSEAASVIPPHDVNASCPEDAYKLHDIISPAVLEALQTHANELAQADKPTLLHWRKEKKYGSFIMLQLSCLPVDEHRRLERCASLLYLHHMIHLYSLKVKDTRKKDFLPLSLPELFRNDLSEKFTLTARGPQGKLERHIPARLKDKLLSYILVTSLILDNYYLEFTPLIIDLSTTKERITNYLRAVGCSVKIGKEGTGKDTVSMKIATLPVPLQFPEIKSKNRKDRR